MLFWLAVFTGAIFAVIAVEVGFYGTWILLFNVVLSAYMAVFLTPVIAAAIPAATAAPFGYALTLLSTAIATFSIAYGVCFVLLSGRLRVELSKALDILGAGFLGFLSGFLVSSFVTLSFCLTPWALTDFCKSYGFDVQSQATNTSYVCHWCNLLHCVVSSSPTRQTAEQVVAGLLEKAGKPPADRPTPKPPSPPPRPN
jgi:hypothetical protein